MNHSEILKDLVPKVFELVTDPPCKSCGYWDKQGHYCFIEAIHPRTSYPNPLYICDLTQGIVAAFLQFMSDSFNEEIATDSVQE